VTNADIAARARFDDIRYAQLWEDADVLVDALATPPGATLVSIASAGDNALAMLLLDPARVIAIDLSPAQIACLTIRIAAYRVLDHASFLELMGSHPSTRRGELLDAVAKNLGAADQAFWSTRRDGVTRRGLGGVGKFENYFRIFRSYLLPLAQSRSTINEVFPLQTEGGARRVLRSPLEQLAMATGAQDILFEFRHGPARPRPGLLRPRRG
jgi:S-adenosylmethionine-diacylglycerol 3-amino-3-carboxypropyl transferase